MYKYNVKQSSFDEPLFETKWSTNKKKIKSKAEAYKDNLLKKNMRFLVLEENFEFFPIKSLLKMNFGK
jgi:hypothetical protein